MNEMVTRQRTFAKALENYEGPSGIKENQKKFLEYLNYTHKYSVLNLVEK